MELFDTHFVQFGKVLAVSGQKTLAISNRYLQVVESQPYLDYFQNTHSNIKIPQYEFALKMQGGLMRKGGGGRICGTLR